jgi:hypothetical protein
MSGLLLVSYIALWVLVILIAVIQLTVLHNLGAIYEQFPKMRPAPTKLKTHDYLPPIQLKANKSAQLKTSSEFKGTRMAISIVSPHCGSCLTHLQQMGLEGAQADPTDPSVKDRVVIAIGEPEEVRQLIDRAKLPDFLPVFVDSGRQVVDIWGITSTPATIIVNGDHRIERQIFSS